MAVHPSNPKWCNKYPKGLPKVEIDPPITTAAKVAKNDPVFKALCEAQGVVPTKRQARKWLAKVGRWAPDKVVVGKKMAG